MFKTNALSYTHEGKTYQIRPNVLIDLRNNKEAPEDMRQMGALLHVAYKKRTKPGFFSLLFNK